MIDLNNFNADRLLYSKENILKFINPYDIYAYYLDYEVELGEMINSPLRVDKKPSFNLFYSDQYSEIMWHDFTLGSGCCIQFVSEMFDINYYNALCRIASDFNLEDEFISHKNKVNKSNDNKKKISIGKNKMPKKKSIINIKSKEWTDFELFWWKYFGVDKDTLDRYNVVPISHYFINNKIFKTDDLAFAFKEYKKNVLTFKIYQPYSNNKWYSNQDSSVIQGWRQLPQKGEELIITSSLKDLMSIVCITGVPAIAPQAESAKINKSVLLNLSKRFKKIYILYDNDYNKSKNWGQINAKKIISEFNRFKNIVIPMEFMSKDFSDLVKRYGETESLNIFNKIKNG